MRARFFSIMKAASKQQGKSLLKPDTNRLALEIFLLNRRQSLAEVQSIVGDANRDMVNMQAQLVLCPDLDRYWMPKPILYQKLDLSKEYLDNLETAERRLFSSPFNTRLLYLQSFVHPSIAEALSMKSKLPLKETRLLTQERLIPLGETVIQMTIQHYLLQRNPQLRPAIVKEMQWKCSENIIIGDLAKKMDIDNLLLVNGESTAQLNHEMNADLVRSIIGAVYLDRDLLAALKFSFTHFAPLLSSTIDILLKQHR